MMLEACLSKEDVKAVVFEMDKDSAVGLDSFSALFYQTCWEIIKEDLMSAVTNFFLGSQQPLGFMSTMVVLLPK